MTAPAYRPSRVLLAAFALVLAFALWPAGAVAASGGLATGGEKRQGAASPPAPEGECESESGGLIRGSCAPVAKALTTRGRASSPTGAPEAVRKVIEAANRIRTKPYIWGGGHSLWRSEGYDCSGAVSYALHGGEFLEAPLTSGLLTNWGLPGKGRWITVYANARHTFAVIAGLRWDTVGDARGTGPRWHRDMVATAGFVARHPAGY